LLFQVPDFQTLGLENVLAHIIIEKNRKISKLFRFFRNLNDNVKAEEQGNTGKKVLRSAPRADYRTSLFKILSKKGFNFFKQAAASLQMFCSFQSRSP